MHSANYRPIGSLISASGNIKRPYYTKEPGKTMPWGFFMVHLGSDVSAVDRKGRTPLHFAAAHGHLRAAEVLNLAGAKPQAVDCYGATPMQCARQRNHSDVVKYLESLDVENLPSPVFVSEEGPLKELSWLWIDSLCINQDDMVERSAQVQMMSRIHEVSKASVIWLGRAEKSTTNALEVLTKLHRAGSYFITRFLHPFGNNDPSIYSQVGISPVTRSQWTALTALFRRGWFSRAWCIKEMVLAQDIEAFCLRGLRG